MNSFFSISFESVGKMNFLISILLREEKKYNNNQLFEKKNK
jgi:hypothetical protein